MAIKWVHLDTPLGDMIATAEAGAITTLWFADSPGYCTVFGDLGTEDTDDPLWRQLRGWLQAYFAGQNPAIEMPLAPQGSAFRQTVWRLISQIPYGQTTTYGQIAWQVALEGKRSRPPAAQAVGGAIGHNPISIIIPCHRIIGKNGSLTGYGGSLGRKAALLRLEGAGAAKTV